MSVSKPTLYPTLQAPMGIRLYQTFPGCVPQMGHIQNLILSALPNLLSVCLPQLSEVSPSRVTKPDTPVASYSPRPPCPRHHQPPCPVASLCTCPRLQASAPAQGLWLGTVRTASHPISPVPLQNSPPRSPTPPQHDPIHSPLLE